MRRLKIEKNESCESGWLGGGKKGKKENIRQSQKSYIEKLHFLHFLLPHVKADPSMGRLPPEKRKLAKLQI